MGWKALRDLIKEDIVSGKLAPGDRLPTQVQLTLNHGLSRHEVRCALRELQKRGFVRTEQGRGCFVCEQCITHSLTDTRSLRNDAVMQGQEVSTETLEIWRGCDRRTAAATPGLDLIGEVLACEQLAFLDGQVFQIVRHYLCTKRIAIDESVLGQDTDLADMLLAGGVLHYSQTKSRVTARKPSAMERVHLCIAPSQPVIDMLTWWGDSTSRPIATTHSVTRADRLALEI